METELRKAIEQNRVKTETALQDISILKTEFRQMRESINEKHAQNRKDIHGLRNELQTMMDKFTFKLEKMSKDFTGFCQAMTDTIHNMQLASAKTKGYWLGMGAAVTFILEIVKVAVEHYWK